MVGKRDHCARGGSAIYGWIILSNHSAVMMPLLRAGDAEVTASN